MSEPDWVGSQILRHEADGAFALCCESGVSYRDLHRAVERWAVELDRHGIDQTSTVAVQVGPSFTFIHLVLAIWRLGAQLTLLDFRLTPPERAALLELGQPQFLVSGVKPPGLQWSFREELEVTVSRRPEGQQRQSAHCLVQMTSGSTGRPKVVGRRQADLTVELQRFDAIAGSVRPGDRVLLLNSLNHTFGLVGGVLHTLRHGASLLFAERPVGRSILDRLVTSAATVVFGVPFHFEMLAATPSAGPLTPIRAAVSGGELMPERVRTAFAERYGVPVGEAYGMTEVGIIAADYLGAHPGAVGPLAAGLVGRIADDQLEIWTGTSPYLHDSGGDRYSEGWLRTHDTAAIDEQDVLTIGPRTDSVVVIGGLKVDLTEVETVLGQHPDVITAVVVMGTTIEAYLETSRPVRPAELAAWCRSRLAGYKLPKSMTVVSSLPRTATGKLKRGRDELRAAGRGDRT